MWQEFFSFVKPGSLKAMAGVANIGDDTNWCGHHFAQANWYAFGRLAWNPNLRSADIAYEWLRQTWDPISNPKRPLLKTRVNLCSALYPARYGDPWGTLVDLMMSSREACVNYMMPLGIHHIFAGTHHYGPEPWYAPRQVLPLQEYCQHN